ncbi:glutaredoxin [Pelagicoccus enzymogenes]|uniref:glutaredoxin family protein n=1 Tax=Pelagicoccus enzymogenes TaxID=2773457 RepID=UPI00280CDFC6|nr:glutaredoxin [Pelagicoccus enzymogenes]MDQ8200794.1 glutaredoxin [Pelagicoccus enzymogenes]
MSKKATIYRMVTPKHLCPWGIKALDLLRRAGFEIEDRHLESEEANQAYKEEQGVSETPQIYIEGERLGGYDDLREYLGKGPDPSEGKTYQTIVAVFSVSFAMAAATASAADGPFSWIGLLEKFVAFSMCVLGILKLQDLKSFATGFVQYDLIAQRFVPYASLYAFVEAGAGALMIGHIASLFVAPLVLLLSSVGAISVFKAVYLEKRDLNCACVGGGSKVPLGFVSLTENLMMMAMAVWMFLKALG